MKRAQWRSGSKTRSNADVDLIPRLRVQPYQKSQKLQVPGTTQLTSCDASGNVALSIGINQGLILNLATRFGTTYDEMRILKAYCEIRPVASSTTSGLTIFFIDENDNGTPGLSQARTHFGNAVSNNGQAFQVSRGISRKLSTVPSEGIQLIEWSNRDIQDLNFLDTTDASTSLAYLKVYSDNANLGTPAVAQPLFVIRWTLTVEVRGMK